MQLRETLGGIYIRGWFWFDILVVSVDWALNVYEMAACSFPMSLR